MEGFKTALAAARNFGLGAYRDALRGYSSLLLVHGRIADAIAPLAEVIDIDRDDPTHDIVPDLGQLGLWKVQAGDLEGGQRVFDEAQRLAAARGSEYAIAQLGVAVGFATLLAGDLDAAEHHLESARAAALADGDAPGDLMQALAGLAEIAERRGDIAAANMLLESRRPVLRAMRPVAESMAVEELGDLADRCGELVRAGQLYREAAEIAAPGEGSRPRGRQIAKAALASGDLDSAERALADITPPLGDWRYPPVLRLRSDVAAARGDVALAREQAALAVEASATALRREEEQRALLCLERAHLAAGEVDAATAPLHTALALPRKGREQAVGIELLEGAARLAIASGRAERGATLVAVAAESRRELGLRPQTLERDDLAVWAARAHAELGEAAYAEAVSAATGLDLDTVLAEEVSSLTP